MLWTKGFMFFIGSNPLPQQSSKGCFNRKQYSSNQRSTFVYNNLFWDV